MYTAPSNWNHSPDIRDTHALTDVDRACLDDVRDVLARHGCLDVFGVNLLHKHFEMEADEILVELVNEEDRRLVTKPVKLSEVSVEMPQAYETQWSWRRDLNGEVATICLVRCFPGNWQSPGHVPSHCGW